MRRGSPPQRGLSSHEAHYGAQHLERRDCTSPTHPTRHRTVTANREHPHQTRQPQRREVERSRCASRPSCREYRPNFDHRSGLVGRHQWLSACRIDFVGHPTGATNPRRNYRLKWRSMCRTNPPNGSVCTRKAPQSGRDSKSPIHVRSGPNRFTLSALHLRTSGGTG